MPRVPAVDGPSVQATGLAKNAYEQAPVALGQAGMVRAQQLGQAAQAADAFMQARERQQNRDDLDAVFRAETALKDDYIKFEREELGKQGVNAKGLGERAKTWWGEAEKKYSEGLTDRQRSAYQRSATALRLSSSNTLGRHEQHQSNEALKESSQARIGAAIDLAIGDPTPDRVAAAKKEITEAVAIVGNMQGMPPEMQQRKVGEALTILHKNIVMQTVDRDPDAAKAYYYTHKKEIDGAARGTIEKALETGGRLQKAQEAADALVVQFGDNVPAAMAHIEKTYSGEEEKAIKAEFTQRYSTVKATKQQMSQTAYETAMLHTVQGQKVPAAIWSQMDDGHKAAIIEKREAEAKQRRAEAEGKGIKTDWSTWDKLNRLSTDDPKAFAAFDLGRVADRVSRQDMEEFGKLQRKMRSGDDKPVKDAVTLTQQVDVIADNLRLRPNSEEHAALRKSIFDEINAAQERADKPLDYKTRQEIIDRQVMKVVTSKGWMWDTKKPVYQLTPEERAKAAPTADDRKALLDRFKARGVEKPTEEQITDAFRRWKGL